MAEASPSLQRGTLPAAIEALGPMTDGVLPISDEERRTRVAEAQRLMQELELDGVFMEGTTSCAYFAGVRWAQTERAFGLVIPARGDVAWICPKFEESRLSEHVHPGADVRTWEEPESPFTLIAGVLRDRGVRHHRLGMEERVRFFIADGIRRDAPDLELLDATPVTAGCRIYKSPAEIALLQYANEATIMAYRAALSTLYEGMPREELAENVLAAFRRLGLPGTASAQFGSCSAIPHGSRAPQRLREGDVVLIDGGTSVEGYRSDITRTLVFGTASRRQLDVWRLELEAQNAAFEAARPGATCAAVDAAARKVLADAGFGPGYRTPGLPHRTGHGIGMDGHEWTHFVEGNETRLRPGMCFSDEPMIVIPGEFGIRLEDCLYTTETGARFFTRQAAAIDDPCPTGEPRAT